MDIKLYTKATIYQLLVVSFITLTLVLASSMNAVGKNYYFSTSTGDDSRSSTQAQNYSTPWKTISKLNSYFSSLLPGDSVLLKRGEVFYGSIIVKKSGTSSLPIVIGAYGTGSNPVISGFVTLSSWVNQGSNIWKATIPTSNTTLNVLIINGSQQAMGRYPNSTFLTYESASGNTSITDNQLTGTPNWTGAEVVIRKIRWMLDRNIITNHVSNTLTYKTGSAWVPTASYGYFIQNDARTLDIFGEWYFNSSDKSIKMYSSVNPSSYTIKSSVLSNLVSLLNYNYITFSNLTFEGSNEDAIVIESGKKIVIKNCTLNFSGKSAILTTNASTNATITIDGNIINNANQCAVNLGNSSTNAWIKNNVIKNIGIIEGAGTNDEDSGDAIDTHGKNTLIEYNKIDSVGHIGIKITTSDSIVARYNEISNYCLTRYDGGGVYTWNAFGTVPHGQQIVQNIVLNSNQVGTGINNETLLNIRGIYCDDCSNNINIDGNTVYNASTAGIYLLRSANIKINNNTCFNNLQQLSLKYAYGTDLLIRNLEINNNIFVSKNASQLALYFQTTGNDIALFGKADNNFYARPIDDNLTIQTIDATNGTVNRALSGWQTLSKQDSHSKKSPKTVTTTNDIRFEYNATKANKTIVLPGTYIDVKGTAYVNSITLKPYTSAVLILSSASTNLTPVIQNQSFQINEKSANGTNVGTVIASDPNAGQTLAYSILSGNTNTVFALNASTGVLTVANSAALNIKTTPSYSLLVKVQDNGTGNLTSQATITVNLVSVSGCTATGNISYQVWNNIGSSSSVSSLTSNSNYPDNPTSASLLTSMEAPSNKADNYGARIAGYICAPATGSYTFWIASADNGELWLSSDDQPANKQKIAYQTSYTSSREWNKYATQKSATINLVQGRTYYIEALMKENINSDNLAVGWLKPGQTGTEPSEVIPGSVLSPLGISVNLPPVISNQVFSINENLPNGTYVGTVDASDQNSGQTLTYSILSGNTNNAFSINTSSGDLTVATSSALNFQTTPTFALIVKVQDNGTGSLSSQATITVKLIDVINSCTATGNIRYQVWNNIGTSSSVSSLTSISNYPNNPTSSILLTSMEAPINQADNYGARIAGYICAPATGSYTFWIASSDNGELWLSTDNLPDNKQKIAYHTSWTSSREWNKYATQKSAVINLVKGQTYYIEALMKENINSDNLAVGWLKPGENGSVPSEVIPGTVLSPLVTTKSTITLPDLQTTVIDTNNISNLPNRFSSFGDSISNLTSNSITIYPNPVTDKTLTVQLEGSIQDEFDLFIYDISGRMLLQRNFKQQNKVSIDLSAFHAGLYVLLIRTINFKFSDKFILK